MKKCLIVLLITTLIFTLSSCLVRNANVIYSETEIKAIIDQVIFSKYGSFTLAKEQIEDEWGEGLERKLKSEEDILKEYVVYNCDNGGKLYLFYSGELKVNPPVEVRSNLPVEAVFSMKRLSKKDFENIEVGKTTKTDIEKIDPATEVTYCQQSKIWDNGTDKCSRHLTEDGILYILYREKKNGELVVKDSKFMYEDIIDKIHKKDLI